MATSKVTASPAPQTSFTSLSESRITYATTDSYLGVSFTLTRPSIVIASQNYNNAMPENLIISTSNTSLSQQNILGSASLNAGTMTVLNVVLPAGTYYLWGSANAAAGNDTIVKACGI